MMHESDATLAEENITSRDHRADVHLRGGPSDERGIPIAKSQ